MNTSQLTITQLASTINAHMGKAHQYADKAEQHFKAMGIHLIEAKQRIAAGEYEGGFVAFLNAECKGLSKSRAYELIAIGNGSKTVAAGRKVKAEGMQKARLAIRHVVDSEKPPEVDTDATANILKDEAVLDQMVEEKRQMLLALGWKLIAGNQLAQVRQEDFDFWCKANGYSHIPADVRWDLMFAAKYEEEIAELRDNLRYPNLAMGAHRDFFSFVLNESGAKKAARAEMPENKLLVKITKACEGFNEAQLEKALKAIHRVTART